MMNAIEAIERTQQVQRPDMRSGDTVRVHVRVREGEKERVQVFEGIVIGVRRGSARASFTVRKVSFGQGVERIFPMHSPTIQKVDVVRSAKVRRAKLYFLRELKGKAARAGIVGWVLASKGLVGWFAHARCARSRTPADASGSCALQASTKWD